MRESVLDAIRKGHWDFEPRQVADEEFDSTEALPGSTDKITKLAERVQEGLPLWHPNDRQSFDDSEEAFL
jgi:hypothetical protein